MSRFMRWWSFWRFGKRDVKGRKLKSFSSATFAGLLEKLSPGKSALFADHSLSEPLRGEFELSANAFS